jgi:large subunit ribosomal protein L22
MKAQSIAYQKFIHEAPRKLRLVADLIRGKKVAEALDQLKFSSKKSARTIGKVLVQAKANAVATHKTPEAALTVKEVQIEEGPRIKRWRPVSRGMAHGYVKRTSHIKITVEGTKPEPAPQKTQQKPPKEGK